MKKACRRKADEMFETIPQAPQYEINTKGRVRNKKTGNFLKWYKVKGKTEQLSLKVDKYGKTVSVTKCSLLWYLFGIAASKKMPIPCRVKKGTRSLRFDSLAECARWFAMYHGKTYGRYLGSLGKRQKHIGGWVIEYLTP